MAITGTDQNDTLNGTAFADTINAGAGDDLVNAGDGGDYVLAGDGNDTVYGANGADRLYGGNGNDSLSGGSGNDQLYGEAGNDTLRGGTGNDTLNGGTGMDYADYTDATAGVSVNLSAGTATGGGGTDALSGIDGIYGSTYADTLIGFDGQSTSVADGYTNVFYGYGGADSLDGAGGDDSLYGGDDNDTVLGGAGNDLVSGDAGNDSVDGGTGNDVASGGAGNDTVTGGAGNDTVSGDAGNDLVLGGAGADSLDGGAGNDTLTGGADNDVILGGDGADSINTGEGNDTVNGGAGSDTISVASGGNTVIIGSEDADNSDVDTLQVFRHNIDWSRTVITGESGTIVWLNGATTSFTNIENVEFVRNVPCFTPGTRIETKRGRVPVETLRLGDRVLTRDNGYQAIRWIGRRRLKASDLAVAPHLQPVRIAAGSLGEGLPEADMLVSPQHRMLISGARAELLFGEAEVLAAAAHMVGLPGITRVQRDEVTYLHLMFDAHEIIRAEGAWTESFQPGDHTLSGLDAPQREELFQIFPDLGKIARQGRWTAARRSLKAHEVRVLLSLAA